MNRTREIVGILFPSPAALLGFAMLALFIFVSIILGPHTETIRAFFMLQNIDIAAKISFVTSLLLNFGTNMTHGGIAYSVIVSVLMSANLMAFVSYYRKFKTIKFGSKILGVGFIGFFLGILGIGCAACGSVLALYLLSLAGGSTLLSFLPYGGLEFSYLSIIVLCVSLGILVRNTQKANIC